MSDNFDTTLYAQFLKNEGATNVATMGYASFPAAVAATKYLASTAKGLGLKVGYESTSVPASGINATAIALSMKNAGVDSFYPVLQTSDALNVLVAARQEGVQLKVPLITTGYGQDFLDDPSAVRAGQGAYYFAHQVPTEEKTPATLAQAAALSKYAGYSGDPSINVTYGWLNADLAIAGMKAAGGNPTKASVISAVRNKVTDWTGGGLTPLPMDFSLKDFGKSPQKQCGYFAKLNGTTFTPVPASGAPTCGTKTK